MYKLIKLAVVNPILVVEFLPKDLFLMKMHLLKKLHCYYLVILVIKAKSVISNGASESGNKYVDAKDADLICHHPLMGCWMSMFECLIRMLNEDVQ